MMKDGYSFLLTLIISPFVDIAWEQSNGECMQMANYCARYKIASNNSVNQNNAELICQKKITGQSNRFENHILELSNNISQIMSENERIEYERKRKEETIERAIQNLMNISQQLQSETRGDMKKLWKDIQENFSSTQQHFSNVSDRVRFHTNIEIENMRSFVFEKVWYIVVVFATTVLILMSIWCMCKKQSKTVQQSPMRDDTKKLSNFENNIAVISFSADNANLHLKMARSVTADFECQPIILGGMKNLSGLQLTSKVCFIFVDKNTRNIILETDNDVSKTKSDFVQSIIKQGNTQVLVIYCQHENSNNLTRLCHRDLGNVQNHKILSHLKKLNCVLSIDSEFSPYQKDYLRIFLNESLS